MATTFRSKKNHPLGVGTLNTAINSSVLSIVLDAGQGAAFPSSGQFTVTIDEEIILIDSRSTDTLTVNASGRGYDSSTASAHAAGVAITNNQIVKDFTDCETAINGIENGTTTLAKVITDGSAASSMKLSDSGTNTVVSVLELYHMSSGTPASGLGAKLLLGAEDSAGNAEAAVEIHGYLTTVTNTSEQGAFLLRVKNAGSFMDALAITVASNTVTVGSNQTTVNLWNTVATTINMGGAATTVNLGDTDADCTHTFGRGKLHSAVSDWILLSHFDQATSSTYAIGQAAAGQVRVNGVTGQGLLLCVANAAKVTFDGTTMTFADAIDMVFNTTTGTKHGTATTQKQSFWNATPIAQPSSTGETTGFTAGGGTNVTDASTFTGNVGSTAYRISDIVKHLKNIGLIAA